MILLFRPSPTRLPMPFLALSKTKPNLRVVGFSIGPLQATPNAPEKTPPQLLHLGWHIAQRAVPTGDELVRRQIVGDVYCYLCHSEPESAMHLLLHCPMAGSMAGVRSSRWHPSSMLKFIRSVLFGLSWKKAMFHTLFCGCSSFFMIFGPCETK